MTASFERSRLRPGCGRTPSAKPRVFDGDLLQIAREVAAHRHGLVADAANLVRRRRRARPLQYFRAFPRARSENQNSSPLWNSSDAKIATSTVGTAAITEKSATRRVWSRPLPKPALLRPRHRNAAREQHHQDDRRNQGRDEQQRDQRRRQQGSRRPVPAQQPNAEAHGARAAERRARQWRNYRSARSPAPSPASCLSSTSSNPIRRHAHPSLWR